MSPWKISLNQDASNLRHIFEKAWRFYIEDVLKVDMEGEADIWVEDILKVKNIGRDGNGFNFLVDSKYYKRICPTDFKNFIEHGYTVTAFGLHEFWPGNTFLKKKGVLPFMFYQTHKSALRKINCDDMIEHVYVNFVGPSGAENFDLAKEVFLARYKEPGFISSSKLSKLGVPQNFYSSNGGLRESLLRIAEKYRLYFRKEDVAEQWSASKFRKDNPEEYWTSCKYCGLKPVDLHHLLPRKDYPNFCFTNENVVPVCIQVHGLISRNQLTPSQIEKYQKSIINWKRADDGNKKMAFDSIMCELHEQVYGSLKYN